MDGSAVRGAETTSESIAMQRTPEDLAEAFRLQLVAAVSDGHLSQQELDALCAMAMGRGDMKDVDSARTMVIAQARALAPSVIIDDEFAL